jgi:hypothetical protein
MKKRATALVVLMTFAAVFPAAARAKHADVVVTVDARHLWQSVPLKVSRRGTVRFDAHGRWVFNPSQPPVDADGEASLPTAGRTSYAFSGTTGREGQLIGRIGRANPPFVAGAHGFHKVAPRERGRLFLMINDDFHNAAGAGLSDNSGLLRVRIDYDR